MLICRLIVNKSISTSLAGVNIVNDKSRNNKTLYLYTIGEQHSLWVVGPILLVTQHEVIQR